MKHTPLFGLLLCCAMLLAPGCIGRMIDEGVEKTLGPTGKVLPMDPKWPENDHAYLGNYENFEIGTIKTDFADVPRDFMECLPTELAEQLASKDLPANRSGKTLQINITILAYQPVSSYHKALGPTEEVVARVELTDKASGKPVGRAICIGRTYQSVGLGPRWKAWGLSRAIVNNWINEYYPKEGRKEGPEKPRDT